MFRPTDPQQEMFGVAGLTRSCGRVALRLRGMAAPAAPGDAAPGAGTAH